MKCCVCGNEENNTSKEGYEVCSKCQNIISESDDNCPYEIIIRNRKENRELKKFLCDGLVMCHRVHSESGEIMGVGTVGMNMPQQIMALTSIQSGLEKMADGILEKAKKPITAEELINDILSMIEELKK